MKRAKYHKKEASIFELLSDISLSTLGLFLIFFVVYSLIFNSKSSAIKSQSSKLEAEVIQLKEEQAKLLDRNLNLTQELDRVQQENENFKTKISELNKRENEVEQKVQLILQQNQYTGYYKGVSTSRFYYDGCEGNNFSEIEQEHTIIYIQPLNLVFYSITSKYGTLTYRYRGNLQGNTFKSDSSEYSRTQSIESCGDRGEAQILINFSDNYLDVYSIDSNSNIENSVASRLNKVN